MEDFIQQLLSNPWVCLFLAIIAVSGFVITYRSTPQKVIRYTISNFELITNGQSALSDLSIFYDEIEITKLTVTRVVFWNDSFPTIHNTDLIDAAPFTISTKNGNIFKVSVINGSETPNKINALLLDNKNAKIFFDYLDRKEGGIIQIIHTDEPESIKISSKIKGGKIISSKNKWLKRFLIIFVPAIIFAFLVEDNSFGLFPKSWYITKEVTNLSPKYEALSTFVISIPLSVCFIFYFIEKRIGITPKNCRKFSLLIKLQNLFS